MRDSVALDWVVLEIEDDNEWLAVTSQNQPQNQPQHPSQPSGWRRAQIGVSVAVLIAVLAALAGLRLWNEAQLGIAEIEGDVQALVRVETARQNAVEQSAALQAALQAVEIDQRGLMVRVIVTETTGGTFAYSFTESRFYTRDRTGWHSSDPLISFWGDEALLDTANLHFVFHELDRRVVDEVAQPLDAYVGELRVFLGLPALTPAERITVIVAPTTSPSGSITVDGVIHQPSPLVLRVPTCSDDKSVLLTRLRSLLLSRTMGELIDTNNVGAEWLPIVESLSGWITRNGIPATNSGAGKTSNSGAMPAQCTALKHSTLFYRHEDLGSGPDVDVTITYDGDRLFAFVISGKTQATMPKLLSAFGHHTSWESLTQEVFGISYEELRRMWSCDSQAEKTGEVSAFV